MNTETQNLGIDEQLFRDILSTAEHNTALHTMGIRITYLGPGTAGLKMYCDPKFSNHMGSIHGAVIAGLIDNAMGLSMESSGRRGVTLEMSLNYIAPVMENTVVTAEGRVVYAGKKTAVIEASLFTENGELAAKGKGTFYLRPDMVG
jgi:uncharacterized protein (TIGR00369 family)